MYQSESELFLASCGAGTSLRVLMHTPEQGPPREHVFDRPFFVAGRDPRSCLRLKDPDVSRRHAYFQVIEGRLLCVDLASRTGVIWPGGKVRSSGWLAPSARVSLGSFCLSTLIDQPAGESPVEDLPDRDPLLDQITRPGWPQATIELSGGDQPRTYRCRVNRMVVLVGCAPSCRIRVKHPSVSRFHCSFVWTPLGVWLVDLLGRNGTHLNGRPISWARIADGDEVGVGAYRLRVRYRDAGSSTDERLPALPEKPVLAGQSTDTSLLELSTRHGAGPEAQLLLPVMQQFNVMQQQLCDQFQQTTLMMFRMFTSMHQEQASLIREEMQQIQRVTAELQALQRQVHDGDAPERQGSPPRETMPRPTGPSLPPTRHVRAPGTLAGAKPFNDRADAGVQPTAPFALPAPDQAPLPAASPVEVDAWLNQRISELQAERQSRWQRVLSFLSGQ
jgi:pSer/pThr/pTyr-binding forkhead associated (FHA) protein